MKITVTQEHINEARDLLNSDQYVSVYCKCPIALALQEAMNDPNWRVGGECIWRAGFMNAIVLPKEASTFIFKFDNNEEVKPFSFEVNI